RKQLAMRNIPSKGDSASLRGKRPVRPGMKGGERMPRPGDRHGTGLIPVEVSRIERRDMADYILASTTLEALREVEVFAKASGIALELRVEEGASVSSGDTLVVLDDREAGLNLRRAEITFQEAENSLKRSREMISRKLISEEEYESTHLACENILTSLKEARLAFEYTRVTAPIDGTITERSVELGSMVTQGKVLFRLADFDPLRARIYIPEKELRRLSVGQQVFLNVDSEPDREFPAVVELISSVIDPSSGTFKVTVEIGSTGGILRPGMFASARIIVDRHANTPVVPAEAVLYEGKQRYIYVIRDGAASRIDVETGFTGRGCVEIHGRFEEGEMVVVAGHNNLAEGTQVDVVKVISGGEPEGRRDTESGIERSPSASTGQEN
ncbi:MAG: efflux RND transporter periplasmic adaptor subunit, partial [Candidatus Krumholzibacteria bacterium]|nr:efflux RND transporter periplasmic adaptor subunit [Candidatus Krumholzibacteria bacterium]